jgi:hypothetical protein
MFLRNHKRRGSSTIEFTLVGIPMIFVLVSTFEIARGMWMYHTLAYGVKEGTRYASVHGKACATAPNNCSVTVAQVAQRISNSAAGLLPGQFTNCLANNSLWPPDPGNALGSDIQISGVYPFQSGLAMLWPGAGPGVNFTVANFPASSKETMQN